MTLAYTLAIRGVARELILVGRDRERARGEAIDLGQVQAFLRGSLEVRAGTLDDVAGADAVAVCASVPMTPGLTDRNALAEGNGALMRELLPRIAVVAPEALLVMLSNPVDVLTWQALRLTGMPPERVVGMGTLVDSARFREALSLELGIHPDDLRSYVLGEHGDTQFPVMSSAQAGGEPIEDTAERRALFRSTVASGVEVFRLKGHTCYAVAMATASMLEAALYDEKRTMPLSIEINGHYGVSGVCLSVPVVVGRGGVERVLRPRLNPGETEAFRRCAEAVRAVMERAGVVEG